MREKPVTVGQPVKEAGQIVDGDDPAATYHKSLIFHFNDESLLTPNPPQRERPGRRLPL